jgi:tetratricopeptide (TPR) repeat protein
MSPVVLGMMVFVLLYLRMCNSDSNRVGIEYYEKGDYALALQHFDEYLTLFPDDIKTLFNRGLCYEKLGQLEKAREDLFAVIDKDPDHINALLACTRLSYELGDLRTAVHLSTYALMLDDKNYLAHYYNGRALHKTGDFDGALSSYTDAIKLKRDFGMAYFQRASLFISVGFTGIGCMDLHTADSLKVEGASKAIFKHCERKLLAEHR